MKNFARCDCDAAASALEREISSPAAWRRIGDDADGRGLTEVKSPLNDAPAHRFFGDLK
jgi:hypothetical protein